MRRNDALGAVPYAAAARHMLAGLVERATTVVPHELAWRF